MPSPSVSQTRPLPSNPTRPMQMVRILPRVCAARSKRHRAPCDVDALHAFDEPIAGEPRLHGAGPEIKRLQRAVAVAFRHPQRFIGFIDALKEVPDIGIDAGLRCIDDDLARRAGADVDADELPKTSVAPGDDEAVERTVLRPLRIAHKVRSGEQRFRRSRSRGPTSFPSNAACSVRARRPGEE